MKISMSDLRRIIKEESSQDVSEEPAAKNEQYQPGGGRGKTAGQYEAEGHGRILRTVLGKLGNCEKVWDALDRQVRNYARISGEPVTVQQATEFDYYLFVGQLCRTWLNGSYAEEVIADLENDNVISGWGSTEGSSFSIAAMNTVADRYGCGD